MSRQVYLAGMALYVLGLAFLLTDELVWSPGVTERNCRRIRPGMTLGQVKAILGREPTAAIEFAVGRTSLRRTWYTKDDVICDVFFSDNGVVQSAEWDTGARRYWTSDLVYERRPK